MRTITYFIEQQNRMNQIFNHPLFPAVSELSQEQVTELCQTIDSKLSPENLHCDGEISRREAKKMETYLLKAFNELQENTRHTANLTEY